MSGAKGGAFRSLRHYNYRLWAGGALVSNIGTGVQRTAQDWLVLTVLTHGRASAVGIVIALQFAPQLLLLPWTGSAADHTDQRRLLMLTQAGMGALALLLGLLTVGGLIQLWQVYVFALLSGCVSAFDSPVRQVFVAQLVGDEDLPNAVALNSMSFNGGALIGPAVSGLMIAAVGTGWAFLLNGLSFLAVLASLLLLRKDELFPPTARKRTPGSFVEGLRYVRSRPDLLAILAMLFLIGTFAFNFPIFVSTMAVHEFHADARAFGVLTSAMSVGTLAGAFLTARSDRPTMRRLVWSSGLVGLGFVLAALAPNYWAFAATLAFAGFATMAFVTATNGLMQLSTEPALRGRVMALRIGIALGGAPLGALLLGSVADHLGPRWTLAIAAASGLAAAGVATSALLRDKRATGSDEARS